MQLWKRKRPFIPKKNGSLDRNVSTDSVKPPTQSVSPPTPGRLIPPIPPTLPSPQPNVRRTTSDTSTSSKFNSKNLRSNLTREQKNRDPLFFYEIVKTIGAGSMGSVARVRKRTDAIGGSARKDIQEAVRRQKRNLECLSLPLIGSLFRFCIDEDLTHEPKSAFVFGGKQISSILRPNGMDIVLDDSTHSLRDSIHESDSEGSGEMKYAMKSIHLSRVTENSFVSELRNEISILRKLDHPHIVRAIETFEHRNQIFIVMELCSGGDLYSRDPYTEEEAARILSSVLSALAYMHSKNVVHRDLKYENILFVNDSPQAEVKLIDFGLSKTYGDNSQLTEGVGTIYTMAPEVLKGNYTTKADVWSVGVIAYMLLASQMPFYGRKRRHVMEQILTCQFDFRGRRWKRISEQAKSFIQDLLVLDPEDRMDAQCALSSSWLNRRFAATTRGANEEEESMAHTAMQRYAGYTKLKKMALMIVAHKSSSEEIGILRKLFQKYDSRGDGSITFDEFCRVLGESGHTREDLEVMFEAVDLDGTGRIRYTEFLAATIEAQGAISEWRLAEAFDRLDCDDSGYISKENLAEILGHDFPAEDIDEIIQEAAVTKDNRISYAEFLSLWETKNEIVRDAQLKLIGKPPEHPSDLELLSHYGSTKSLQEMEASAKRASFIKVKHSPKPTHVVFSDQVFGTSPLEVTEQHPELIMDADYLP